MMDILKKQDIINCLIVVTRYFGGILLGTGGLVKAYSDATKEAIENAKLKDVKVGSLIEYEIKYEELQKLQYICNKNSIDIVDIQYGENINVKINIEKESAPAPERKSAKTPYVTKESQTSSDLLEKLDKAT